MENLPTDEMRPDVSLFVSYARLDSLLVDPFHDELARTGATVWRDTADIEPASDWLDEVEQAIERTSTFVAMLSPRYLASEICRSELRRARLTGKAIVPVLLEPVAIPEGLEWVGDINWISLLRAAELKGAADLVLRAATTDRDWTSLHTRLLGLARTWDSAGRPRSQVLRGSAIEEAERALAIPRPVGQPQAVDLQISFVSASRRDQRRRRSLLTGSVATAAVVALALGSLAVIQRGRAESAREKGALTRREAEARDLIQRSAASDDALTAAFLALESEYRTTEPLAEARIAWMQATSRLSKSMLIDAPTNASGGNESTLVWSPDSSVAAVVDQGGLLRLQRLDGAQVGSAVQLDKGSVPVWVGSPSVVVGVTPSGGVAVLDTNGTVLNSPLTGVELILGANPVRQQIAVSTSAREVAIVGLDGTVVEPSDYFSSDIFDVQWSSDGDRFVTGQQELLGDSMNHVAKLYDSTGQRIGEDFVGSVEASKIGDIWSPLGDSFITVTYDGALQLIAATDGLARREAIRWDSPVVAISWDHTGDQAAVGLEDGSIVLCCGPSGESDTIFTGDGHSQVTDLEWNRDDTFLAAGWSDGRTGVIEGPGSGASASADVAGPESVSRLHWEPGLGLRVTYTSPTSLLETTRSFAITPPSEANSTLAELVGVTSAAWSPTDERIALGNRSGELQIVSPDGNVLGVYAVAGSASSGDTAIVGVNWSPDGRYVAAVSSIGARCIIDVQSGTGIEVQQYDNFDFPDQVKWRPDSAALAFIDTTGRPAVFAPDGTYLTEEYFSQQVIENGIGGEVVWLSNSALAWSPYGQDVAIGTEGVTSPTYGSGGAFDSLSSFDWSDSADRFLAATYEGAVHLLDRDGVALKSFQEFGSEGWRGAAWSPTGELIAAFSETGEFRILDQDATVLALGTFNGVGGITSLNWSADSTLLAVLTGDGTYTLVDVSEPTQPLVIETGAASTAEVAFSPEGDGLIRVLTDGSVEIEYAWSEADLCEYLRGVLSAEEMNRLVNLGTSGSACAEGSRLAALTPLPSATRKSPEDTSASAHSSEPSDETSPGGEGDEVDQVQAAFDRIASESGTIDASGISANECGLFAMALRADGVAFYQWTDGLWVNHPEYIDYQFEAPPLEVTTSDFTGDGVADFLVTFDGASLGGRQFGGIFASPRCYWSWTPIVAPDESFDTMIDDLSYQDGGLLAAGYRPEGGRANVRLRYVPADEVFVAEIIEP